MIRKERRRLKKAERDAKYRSKLYDRACEWVAKGPMAVLDYISPDPLPPIIHFLNRKHAVRKAARRDRSRMKRARFYSYQSRMKWIKIGHEINDYVLHYYTTLLYHDMSRMRVGMHCAVTGDNHVFSMRIADIIRERMVTSGALRVHKKYLLWGVRTKFYHEGLKKIFHIRIYRDILKQL